MNFLTIYIIYYRNILTYNVITVKEENKRNQRARVMSGVGFLLKNIQGE